MARRITCCVVFVTLIWGAHTEDEEKVRDMFKSNMTRNDFSNLLKSLIKLNEQRVSVLQKLYRLEDYGVLSEVLRSGDKKTGKNHTNLFLIVMSKNPNDPSRRKVDFQVVDSVTSLDAGNNNNHPKLDFVLDPAGFIFKNIRKENRFDSNFGIFPRRYGPTKTNRAENESKKNTTTTNTQTRPTKTSKPALRTEVKHDRDKTSLKANEARQDRKRHNDHSRFEIVSNKGRRPIASKQLYDGNSNKYAQTVGYNSQSSEYLEIDFTIKNDTLTTKPIIIKKILFSHHKKSKDPLEGKEELDEDDSSSPSSNIKNDHNIHYTKMYRDISIKKLHDNNHHNHKTNKHTPKVKVHSKQKKHKLTTKPIIIKDLFSSNHLNSKYSIEDKDEQDEAYYGSPFSNIENDHNRQYTNISSDVSSKKLYDVNNHHNPKLNKNTPKVKVLSNLPPKVNQHKSKLNNQHIKYSKIKTHIEKTTLQNNYKINGTMNKASVNNYSIKNSNLNNDNTNANNHDLLNTKIQHKDATKEIDNNNKFLTLASETVIPEITKDTQYVSYLGFEDHKDVRDNSNKDKPKTAAATLYGNYPSLEPHKDIMDSLNKDKPKTSIYTAYGSYPGLEHVEDVRDNSKKDKPKTAKDTPFGTYPGFEHHKDVRQNSNKHELKTTIGTPFGNFNGFEHQKNVMNNLNKNKPNTAKEMLYGDNLNAESKKDTDYDGVKMFDDDKKNDERFSVFITDVGNGPAVEVKQQNDPKLILNTFDQPESKPIARQPFAKCLIKKALKLCCKSCIRAYKNVCRRLKCTPRSKKALKIECKRSCKKTFASSSSKYSNDNSYENSDENSDESYSDDDYS